MTKDIHYDLCVIGGGINGTAIARDAAGRGMSVLLLEAQDLAGATSSVSTKMISGWLRCLDGAATSNCCKSLRERDVLYRNAQHLLRPIDCILLGGGAKRAKLRTQLGAWLYDLFSKNKAVPNSRLFKKSDYKYSFPLYAENKVSHIYSDCCVDDTRLTVLNAVDASENGARILTYTSCDKLEIHEGCWHISLRDTRINDNIEVSASMVVNATGPWVGKFLDNVGIGQNDPDLPVARFVRGSHIILPLQYEGDHAYVQQQVGGRIVFIAPYEGKYTLVGATEEDYAGDPREAHISPEEMEYLCQSYNVAFAKPISKSDVIFTYSGVRTILGDAVDGIGKKKACDYLVYHHKRQEVPLLSVYSNKLAACRMLAQDTVDKLMKLSGRTTGAWTAHKPLVGGDFSKDGGLKKYLLKQKRDYPWLPEKMLHRYARAYGTRMDCFLSSAECIEDLGGHYGDDVYEAEINYLKAHEWAYSAQDVIWRRSKIGLHASEETIKNIEATF